MPRRPTGGKPGRPFTYAPGDRRPITYSLRIPWDLSEQLKRYSSRHRQSVTQVLLDGFRRLMEQEDQRA